MLPGRFVRLADRGRQTHRDAVKAERCPRNFLFVPRPQRYLKMVRYSLDPENPTKSCKSRGSNLRVHFK
ncbi:hypothetical protein FQN60_005238, partial [Etheostoma spectabile]